MIAIASQNGVFIKTFPNLKEAGEIFGFHKIFGFISESSLESRLKGRKLKGLSHKDSKFLCKFEVKNSQSGVFINALADCEVRALSESSWELCTAQGIYQVLRQLPQTLPQVTINRKADRGFYVLLFILLAFALAIPTLPLNDQKEVVPEVLPEPVTVKMMVKEKSVTVPKFQADQLPTELTKHVTNKEVKRAIQQDLGFLGMLGKKNLTKALGGMPTSLKDASAGAGPGGTEGSGGEVLVGLGQGVKRVTVGNSGVAGLGGIGTKGRGGGAGGYGNSMVGSGEGRAISSVALSQDIVLEGGLDRNVIQATIAKYLNQVRACYEDGLRDQPGLQGQVAVQFEISPAGSLNFAKVGKSSLGNPKVENCITTRMMNWQFPKPLGGVSVKVNYPFLLRPVNS